jgi:hypothetical protein
MIGREGPSRVRLSCSANHDQGGSAMKESRSLTALMFSAVVFVVVFFTAQPAAALCDPGTGCCCPTTTHTLSGTISGYADCATQERNNEANLLSIAASYCASGACYEQYTQTSDCTTAPDGSTSVSGRVDYRCWLCGG